MPQDERVYGLVLSKSLPHFWYIRRVRASNMSSDRYDPRLERRAYPSTQSVELKGMERKGCRPDHPGPSSEPEVLVIDTS